MVPIYVHTSGKISEALDGACKHELTISVSFLSAMLHLIHEQDKLEELASCGR